MGRKLRLSHKKNEERKKYHCVATLSLRVSIPLKDVSVLPVSISLSVLERDVPTELTVSLPLAHFSALPVSGIVVWKSSSCKDSPEKCLYTSSLPQQFESDFHDVLSSLVTPVVQGSLQSSFHIPATPQHQKDWTIEMIYQSVQLPKSYIRSNFDHEDISALTQLYAILYPNISASNITINSTLKKFTTMEYCNAKYRSEMSKYRECCIVFANLLCHHPHTFLPDTTRVPL